MMQSVYLLGAIQMPLFYLLSGFSLALAYAPTVKNEINNTNTNELTEEESEKFSWRTYLRSRVARIMPMYIFSNFFLGAPLLYFNRGNGDAHSYGFPLRCACAVFGSIFPVFMILPAVSLFEPFSFAGWTIGTLFFFYLAFPVLIRKMIILSEKLYENLTVILFWVQVMFAVVLQLALYFYRIPQIHLRWSRMPPGFLNGYWAVTGWGVTRLPVFLMGVNAGLLCLRGHRPSIFDRSLLVNSIYTWFPWPTKKHEETINITRTNEQMKRRWEYLLAITITIHAIIVVLSSVLDIYGHEWIGRSVEYMFQVIMQFVLEF